MNLYNLKYDPKIKSYQDLANIFKKLIKHISCNKKIGSLYKDINTKNETIKILDKKLFVTDPKLINEITLLKKERLEHLLKITELQKQIQEKSTLIIKKTDLSDIVDKLNKELKLTLSEEDLYKFIIDLYHSKNPDLLKKIQGEHTLLTETITQNNIEIEKMKTEIKNLTELNKDTNDKHNKLIEEYNKLLDDKNRLTTEIESFKTNNKLLKDEIQSKLTTIEELQDKLLKIPNIDKEKLNLQLISEKSELEKTIRELKEQKRKLITEIADFKLQVDNLKKEYVKLKKNKFDLTTEIAEINNNKIKNIEELKELGKKIESSKLLLDQLKTEESELVTYIKALQKDNKQLLEMVLNTLERLKEINAKP
jgi:chromosome segregation ATPase